MKGCGTFDPPPEDSPDREAVDQFRDFLRAVDERGVPAVAADPAWRAYIDGIGPAPSPEDRAGGTIT